MCTEALSNVIKAQTCPGHQKKKKKKIMIKVTSDMLAKLLKKAHYMHNIILIV